MFQANQMCLKKTLHNKRVYIPRVVVYQEFEDRLSEKQYEDNLSWVFVHFTKHVFRVQFKFHSS